MRRANPRNIPASLFFHPSPRRQTRRSARWLAALVLAWSAFPALALPVFFEDNFDTLDTTVWSVQDNGYPGPAVSASGGRLQLGQPGTSSLDFPYVTPKVRVLPTTGDFALEIAFRYTGVAGKGDGIVLLGAGNEGQIGGLWQDSYGLRISAGSAGTNLGTSTAEHVLRWELTGLTLRAFLDGSPQANDLLTVRPDKLWLGHPTIGQVLRAGSPPFGPVNFGTGIVESRWWGGGPWTTFEVDYLRVERLDAAGVPEPGTLALLLAGLLGLGGLLRNPARRPAGKTVTG